jgi:hypothetical protein
LAFDEGEHCHRNKDSVSCQTKESERKEIRDVAKKEFLEMEMSVLAVL